MYEQRLPIEEWKAKKQAELKETIAAQKSVLQEVVPVSYTHLTLPTT